MGTGTTESNLFYPLTVVQHMPTGVGGGGKGRPSIPGKKLGVASARSRYSNRAVTLKRDQLEASNLYRDQLQTNHSVERSARNKSLCRDIS